VSFFSRFYSILKPGIIFGNVITVCGGFFLGSQVNYLNYLHSHTFYNSSVFPIFSPISLSHWLLLLITLLGMALIIGSGCVFNNLIDRDIDKLMARTCDRVLVKGLISLKIAFIYGLILGLLGFLIIYLFTNLLTLLISLIGWVFYVFIYSLFLKRRSSWGTILGAVSGAVPPLVGYAAVRNSFDLGAVILFFILFLWQMPHFYAIAIFRLKDFKAAGIPVLPIKKGFFYTRISMLAYIFAYLLLTLLPVYLGYLGWIYGLVAMSSGLAWFWVGLKDLNKNNLKNNLKNKLESGLEISSENISWARKMFFISIINITLICFFMIIRI